PGFRRAAAAPVHRSQRGEEANVVEVVALRLLEGMDGAVEIARGHADPPERLVEQPDTGAAPILERLGEDLPRTGGIALEEGQKRLGGQDASMVGRALFRLLQVLLRLAVEILAVALLAPPERRNVGEVGVRLGVLAVELDDAPGGLHGLPVVAMAV